MQQVDTNEFIDSLTKESQFLGFMYVQPDGSDDESLYDFNFLYVRRTPSEPWHLVHEEVLQVDSDPIQNLTKLTTILVMGPLNGLLDFACADYEALAAVKERATEMAEEDE